MIHRGTQFDFRLKPWPYGFGQFIRSDGAADFFVHDLALYLHERLRAVPHFTVFANTVSLVNVYSPFSRHSYGRLPIPKQKMAQFMPRLVFTFTKDRLNLGNRAHRLSDQVQFFEDAKGVPRSAMISVSNILAKRFGVYSVQGIDLECLYVLVGLVVKALLVNTAAGPIDKYTSVASVINSRSRYEFWGDSQAMWDTKLLGQTHVNNSYATGLSALRFSAQATQYLDLLLPKFLNAVHSCSGDLTRLVNVLPDVYLAQVLANRKHDSRYVGLLQEHAVSLLIDDSAVHQLIGGSP